MSKRGFDMRFALASVLLWACSPLWAQTIGVSIPAANDFPGWAVLEWECCLKHPEGGAREGAEFIRHHFIRVTGHAFDDFAAAGADEAANRRMTGIVND